MRLDLDNEYKSLELAKVKLNEKLTNAFKDKWVIQTRVNNLYGDTEFVKTKKGKFLIFRIETCRPKSTALSNSEYLDELVLIGTDSLGCSRSTTIYRSGIRKSKFGGKIKTDIDPSVYDYNVVLFGTEDEAKLYAEINSSL